MSKSIDILCDDPPLARQSHNVPSGIEYFEGDYDEFFTRYLQLNKPCMMKNVTKNWKSSQSWIKDDAPNINHLRGSYGKMALNLHFLRDMRRSSSTSNFIGDAEVTVANCDKKYFNAQVKTTVKFSEFARYWESLIESNYPQTEPCLYLKVSEKFLAQLTPRSIRR